MYEWFMQVGFCFGEFIIVKSQSQVIAAACPLAPDSLHVLHNNVITGILVGMMHWKAMNPFWD